MYTIDIDLILKNLWFKFSPEENLKINLMLINWVITFIFFLFPHYSFSQNQAPLFTPFPHNSSLTTESIKDILQDDLGYIWIATREGLNRFDGQKIWNVNQDFQNDILGNDIQALAKDQKGQIWMGTVEGFLQCYNPNSNKFSAFKVPTGKNAPVTTIWDIEIGLDGKIWLALERGISCFDATTNTFKTWRPSISSSAFQSKNYDVVYSILPDLHSNHIIWIGSRNGLLKFDSTTEIFEEKTAKVDTPHLAKGIFRMKYNEEGAIIFTASHQTIFIFHPQKDTWEYFQKQHPIAISFRCIFQKSKTEYWIGDIREGLFILDTKKKLVTPFSSLSQNQKINGGVESLFLDNKNTFWIGTEYGIFWNIPSMQKLEHHFLPPPYEDQYCKAFAEIDENNILIATFTGKLFNYHRPTNTWSKYNEDDFPVHIKYIYSMLLDKKGNCWMATREGLFQVDYNNQQVIIPNYKGKEKLTAFNTQQLTEDLSGQIWSNTYPQGLLCIDPLNEKVSHFSFGNNSKINCPPLVGTAAIVSDAEGKIWIGGEPRLNCFDPQLQQCITSLTHQEQDNNNLSNPWIKSMAIEKNGVIWLGYKYGGLERFDPNAPPSNRFNYFSVKDGLPSNKVFRLQLDDQENLWMATGNGIARMNTQNYSIQTFNKQDGLQENNLHKYWRTAFEKEPSGNIYIGGQSFFSIIDPTVFYKKENSSQLTFNGLRVFDQWKSFNKNLNHQPIIELSYEENFFTFEFTNLAARNQQQHFRYRLNGFDREWRYCSDGKADYTDVGGGTYNFMVQVPDQEGNWMVDGLNIELKITPPIWQTKWFQFVIALLFFTLLLLLYQARIKQIKKEEALKTAFNRKLANVEMRALRAQMNPHFLFNSLNSIKNFIIKKEPRTASLYLTKFARLMRLILSNSKDTSVTLENELKALALYIELEAMRFPESFEYVINVEENVPSSSFLLPPLILQPYVENAIKHGLMHKEGKGKLEINISRQSGSIRFIIKDNGIGRDQSQILQSTLPLQRKSMGMQITADRLAMLKYNNGEKPKVIITDLKNAMGKATGTQVEITLPFPKK